jgi:hypothetical protein
MLAYLLLNGHVPHMKYILFCVESKNKKCKNLHLLLSFILVTDIVSTYYTSSNFDVFTAQ